MPSLFFLKAMHSFLSAYIACALWSSTDTLDGESEPEFLDANFSASDIAPEALKTIERECRDFYDANHELWGDKDEQAGHDFWLTRNRHGAGFWDRGIGFYPDGASRALTEAAHVYGSCDLYVGDDGLIYVS